MRQEEKSQQSREKILRAAIAEFGQKGYDGASLNTLLTDNELSKGLIYHYFENKDQIYLSCVQVCFDLLAESLRKINREDRAESMLQTYFQSRGCFFQEHPNLSRIFFEALLQPPEHLRSDLKSAMADFEAVNDSLFQAVLSSLKLREGILREDAWEYFALVQHAFHLRFLSVASGPQEQDTAHFYEEQARRMMKLVLYGLVEEERK